VREPAKLYYGSSYSLDLKHSRNESFIEQQHHYENEVSPNQIYLGPHLHVYNSYKDLMTQALEPNPEPSINAKIEKQFFAATLLKKSANSTNPKSEK
jgi:hypothetical protein